MKLSTSCEQFVCGGSAFAKAGFYLALKILSLISIKLRIIKILDPIASVPYFNNPDTKLALNSCV
ncbi:hypothetical protein [Nonlabens dokdonensis]|uniref:hypothetical protein n=1 Tax=Nonlabens dokdonensis TaxID=328515 RepID=UPI0026F2E1FB|nr:hypothetical protein [Nonlabens dokdonensis]